MASGNSILRALHYPGYFRTEYEGSGAVRAAAHTDINLIILLGRAIEVCRSNFEWKWLNIHCSSNELVVNVGGYVAVIKYAFCIDCA